jgi:hypothetical protein
MLPASPDFPGLGISILPNLLGFTMGGMAIVLAISSSDVFVKLAEEGDPHSFFMKLIASFLHYITSQALALLYCAVTKDLEYGVINFFAGALLIYCIIVPVSVGVQLLQMARIYNARASMRPRSGMSPFQERRMKAIQSGRIKFRGR